MDDMIERVGKLKLAEKDMEQSVHTRCPGHITILKDPTAPCPNCGLVGTVKKRVIAQSEDVENEDFEVPEDEAIILEPVDSAEGETFADDCE